MDILFFNGTSALDKVSKVINIAKSDLVDPADPNVRKVVSLNVMIATWDERSMGDTWKYVGTELDPGTVTTQTTTVASKFGANFKFDTGIGKVIKLGFGLTAEVQYTKTTSIQITSGSDFCGESIVSFLNPVIVGKPFIGYDIEELNTGSVRVIVEPKK